MMGRIMYGGWMTRKKLAETERPALVKVLAALAAVAGLLVIAEGIITGWFLQHVTPYRWEMDFLYGRNPWIKFPQWLAAVCMIVIGIAGIYAGVFLARGKQAGPYLAMTLTAAIFASGAFMLYSGIRFDGSYLTAVGCVNTGVGLALAVLLGLGWYTIDPLGLHWSTSS